MKRHPRPDEIRLWAVVASTVRPGPGRKPVAEPPEDMPVQAAPGGA